MTKEDIIRMAREAGLHLYVNDLTEEPYALVVERFANLVAATEREMFVEVLRQLHDSYSLTSNSNAIRARGTT
jgi:hypothetical protein